MDNELIMSICVSDINTLLVSIDHVVLMEIKESGRMCVYAGADGASIDAYAEWIANGCQYEAEANGNDKTVVWNGLEYSITTEPKSMGQDVSLCYKECSLSTGIYNFVQCIPYSGVDCGITTYKHNNVPVVFSG